MIDRKHRVPVTSQCRLLARARSTAYYKPAGESEENLAVMRAIDELYLERPTRGSRTMKDALERKKGYHVGRERPDAASGRTSTPGKGHKIYPYLLRGLEVNRPRQVYAADITYIPMARGFLYLVAVIDWYSRKVLSSLLRDEILSAVDHVRIGKSLRDALGNSAHLPPLLVAMVAAGDASGQLEKVFARAADYFENELETTLDTLVSLLEPAVILVLGSVLCWVLAALYLPMFEMASVIR